MMPCRLGRYIMPNKYVSIQMFRNPIIYTCMGNEFLWLVFQYVGLGTCTTVLKSNRVDFMTGTKTSPVQRGLRHKPLIYWK